MTLTDISTRQWTQVARRVQITRDEDGWEYQMPPRQVAELEIARAHGSVITTQKRLPDGQLVMMAWRRRIKPGPEEFARLGRGLFDDE